MGIHDREYYRDEGSSQGIHLRPPATLIGKLIAINVLVFFACWFFPPVVRSPSDLSAVEANRVDSDGLPGTDGKDGAEGSSHLLVYEQIHLDPPEIFSHPWKFYQVITYGFVHAPVRMIKEGKSKGTGDGIFHILFNMFALFVFGRSLETQYGQKELLVFYLTAIVLGGLLWSGYGLYDDQILPLVGASGGVYAIAILFCLNYPKQVLLLFGVIPMPAWVVGIMIVAMDQLMGIFADDNVAHSVHLAGAGFALIYYQTGIKLARFVPHRRRGTKLKVHDPDPLPPSRSEKRMQKLVDQGDAILTKLQKHGEESLTGKERRTLERYSREMRDRQED